MLTVVGIIENWCVGTFKRGMGVLSLFFDAIWNEQYCKKFTGFGFRCNLKFSY